MFDKAIFLKVRPIQAALVIAVIFLLSNCESRVSKSNHLYLDESLTNLTQKNQERILQIQLDDPFHFSFALISDSHTDYSNLTDITNHINQDSTLAFLIHVGDFTNLGWVTEYVSTHNILSRLNIPYLTVIGNHDELGDGKLIYSKMFGSFNYSFVFHDYKFVFLKANSLANLGTPPDLDWLEHVLTGSDLYNLVFVIAHQPPFDPSWSDSVENRYHKLIQENKVDLSIHGHTHDFWYGEKYNDGVKYLVVGATSDRSYCTVTIDSTVFEIHKVDIDE